MAYMGGDPTGECNYNANDMCVGGECCPIDYGAMYTSEDYTGCMARTCGATCSGGEDGWVCFSPDLGSPIWGSDGICISDNCCSHSNSVTIDCNGAGIQYWQRDPSTCLQLSEVNGPSLYDGHVYDCGTGADGMACEAGIDTNPDCNTDKGFKQDGIWVNGVCRSNDAVLHNGVFSVGCTDARYGYMCDYSDGNADTHDDDYGNFFYSGYCARNARNSVLFDCHSYQNTEAYYIVMDCNSMQDQHPSEGNPQLTDGGVCQVGTDIAYKNDRTFGVGHNAGDACDHFVGAWAGEDDGDWNANHGYWEQTGTVAYGVDDYNNWRLYCIGAGYPVSYDYQDGDPSNYTFKSKCLNSVSGSMCENHPETGGDFEHNGFCAWQIIEGVGSKLCDDADETVMDCDYNEDEYNNSAAGPTPDVRDLKEGGECRIGEDNVYVNCSYRPGDACTTHNDDGYFWRQNGTCVNSISGYYCDESGEVAYDWTTKQFVESCQDAMAGSPCDSDATSGGDFEQNGYCAINRSDGNKYCDTGMVVIDGDSNPYFNIINDNLSVIMNYTDINNISVPPDLVYSTCELGAWYQSDYPNNKGGDGDACNRALSGSYNGSMPWQTGTCAYDESSGQSVCKGTGHVAYDMIQHRFEVSCVQASVFGGEICEGNPATGGDFDHEGYCVNNDKNICYTGMTSMDCDNDMASDRYDINECEITIDEVISGCNPSDACDITWQDGNHFFQDGVCINSIVCDNFSETSYDTYWESGSGTSNLNLDCTDHPGDSCDWQANHGGDYTENGACIYDVPPSGVFYQNFDNLNLSEWNHTGTGTAEILQIRGEGHGVLHMQNQRMVSQRNTGSTFVIDFKFAMDPCNPSTPSGITFNRAAKDDWPLTSGYLLAFRKTSSSNPFTISLRKQGIVLTSTTSGIDITDKMNLTQGRLAVSLLTDHYGYVYGKRIEFYADGELILEYSDEDTSETGPWSGVYTATSGNIYIDDWHNRWFMWVIEPDSVIQNKPDGPICCLQDYSAGDRGSRWSNLPYPYNTGLEGLTLFDQDEDCGCVKSSEGDYCIEDPKNEGDGLRELWTSSGASGTSWPGRCVYNGDKWHCDERIKDCFIDTDIINETYCDNSTIIGCHIQNCTILDSFLFKENDYYPHDCVCLNSVIYNSTLTNVHVIDSVIINTTATDSFINNSDINDSNLRFSLTEDTDFCGSFDVYGAKIQDWQLISGRVIYNKTTYIGPYSIDSICEGMPPGASGQLAFVPDLAKHDDNVTIYYFGTGLNHSVQIKADQASKVFANSPIILSDNGIAPDETEDDAIYTSEAQVTKTDDGQVTIRANINDIHGNPYTANASLTIDNTNPSAGIIINGGDEHTTSLMVNLELAYSDENGVKECRYGNSKIDERVSWEPCTQNKVWWLEQGEGIKTVWYLVKDNVGNINVTNDTINYTHLLEEIWINDPVPGQKINGTYVVNISSDDILEDAMVSIDEGEWMPADASILPQSETAEYTWNTTLLWDGTHTIQARDIDPRGDYVYSNTVYVLVDNVPQAVTIIRPENGSTLSGEQEILVDVDGDAVRVDFFIDSGGPVYQDYDSNGGWNYTWDTTSVNDGPHNIRAVAWARLLGGLLAWKIGEDTVEVTVDNHANLSFEMPSWINKVYDIEVLETDLDEVSFEASHNNIDYYAIGRDGNDPFMVPWDTREYDDGHYYIRGNGTEFGGQVNTEIRETNVDNSGPQVDINYPGLNDILHGDITITASSTDAGIGIDPGSYEFYIDGVSQGLPAESLVLNMPFNGWSTGRATNDLSGNEYHGTVINASYATDGGHDSMGAYGFDGTSYINISPVPSINTINGSMEAWVYLSSSISSDSSIHGIFEAGISGSLQNYIALRKTISNRIVIRHNVNGVDYTARSDPSSLYNDAWHHFVGVWNSTHISMYVDGEMNENVTRAEYVNADLLDQAVIGAGANSGIHSFFKGSIDNVRLYNRSLTADEVKKIFSDDLGKYEIDTRLMREGDHHVKVTARDWMGNIGESDITPFMVDNTPESVTITQPHSNDVLSEDALIQVLGPDDMKNVTLAFDGCPALDTELEDAPWETMWDVDVCGDGLYNLTAVGYDSLRRYIGNDTITNVRIDLHPNFSISTIDSWVAGIINITAENVEDTVDSILIEITEDDIQYRTIGYMTKDGREWRIAFDTNTVDDGAYMLRATAKNPAGATFTAYSNRFNVDNTAPEIGIDVYFYESSRVYRFGYLLRGLVHVVENSTDPGVGIDNTTYMISFDGGDFIDVTEYFLLNDTEISVLLGWHYYHPWDTNLSSNGEHQIQMKVKDKLGNEGYSQIITRRVDNEMSIGEFTIEPYYVKNRMMIKLRFIGDRLGLEVEANISALDSIANNPIILSDPENRGIYEAHHSISTKNVNPDGEKTVYATVTNYMWYGDDSTGYDPISNTFSAKAFLDNTEPNGTITINPIDIIGMAGQKECTAIPTVNLEMDYHDIDNNGMSGVDMCRYSNGPFQDENATQVVMGSGQNAITVTLYNMSGMFWNMTDVNIYDVFVHDFNNDGKNDVLLNVFHNEKKPPLFFDYLYDLVGLYIIYNNGELDIRTWPKQELYFANITLPSWPGIDRVNQNFGGHISSLDIGDYNNDGKTDVLYAKTSRFSFSTRNDSLVLLENKGKSYDGVSWEKHSFGGCHEYNVDNGYVFWVSYAYYNFSIGTCLDSGSNFLYKAKFVKNDDGYLDIYARAHAGIYVNTSAYIKYLVVNDSDYYLINNGDSNPSNWQRIAIKNPLVSMKRNQIDSLINILTGMTDSECLPFAESSWRGWYMSNLDITKENGKINIIQGHNRDKLKYYTIIDSLNPVNYHHMLIDTLPFASRMWYEHQFEDYDNDGSSDIFAVTSHTLPYTCYDYYLRVYKNNGFPNPKDWTIYNINIPSETRSVSFADLNNDKRKDIILYSFPLSPAYIFFFNNGDEVSSWPRYDEARLNNIYGNMGLGDLDGDGSADLVGFHGVYVGYNNMLNVWSACTDTKAWQLSNSTGLKIVYYQIKDVSGNIYTTSDTIYYDPSGACMDMTPPTQPIVVDDGDYTNSSDTLHAYWYNSTDREQELLHLPLSYRFRIHDTTENLILNPGFETFDSDLNGVMDGWAKSPGTNATRSGDSSNGKFSQMLTQGEIYQDVELKEEEHSISITYKYNESPIQDLRLKICNPLDTGCSSPISEYEIGHNTDWETVEMIFSTDSETYYRILLENPNNEQVFIDNVVLKRTSTVPDAIVDWTDTLENEVTVSGLDLENNHEYTFEVKAVNAAGLESISGFSDGIVSDQRNPDISLWSTTHPDPSQYYSSTTVLMHWQGNDLESGIYAYSYRFDHTNDTEPDDIPEGEMGQFHLKTNATYDMDDGIYYFHIKTQDNVGRWSDTKHFRVMADSELGPPIITLISPIGVTADETPLLHIETNEDAVCSFNQTLPVGGYAYQEFLTTGGRIHESQLGEMDDDDYQFWFNCTDYAGHHNDWNYTNFSVISDVVPTLVEILNFDPPYYVQQRMKLKLLVRYSTDYGFIGIGGLGDDILVTVSGTRYHNTYKDLGGGYYDVFFTAPEEEGTYYLNISVRGTGDLEEEFEVDDFSLTMAYTGDDFELPDDFDPEEIDNYVYGKENYAILGFATDDDNAANANFELTSGALDNNYIFMTNPSASIPRRMAYINEKTFEGLIFPSFGLPLNQDTCMIVATLSYAGTEMSGDQEAPEGIYTIIVRNEGITGNGTINMSVRII